MVLAVCRRVLGDEHDAEDAFQAVFLVLARKAGAIRGSNLAGWLYAVAVRTARGVRIMRDRRRKHEQANGRHEPAGEMPIADRDLAAIIDEELTKLPEIYREPVVLCELRGLSRKQAAEELGIREGTLSSRLAAAKRKLAERLSARGVTIPATLSAMLAPASVSAALLESTTTAIRGAASGVANAAASAVVKGMLFDQLKVVALSAGLLLAAVCGGLAMTGSPGGSDPAPAPRPVHDPATKLVERLGSDDFNERESAAKELRKLGPKAESALKEGLKSHDPEIRARCSTILSAIRKDALDDLVKNFDPVAEKQPEHPVWKRFKTITGDSRASRDLFARIITNKKWLQTLDKAEANPTSAGHIYRVGVAEMFRDFHNDPAKSPPWPCDRPEEVAYLLLLGSYPDDNPPAKLTGDEVVPPNLRGVEFLGRGIIFGEGQILHAQGIELGLKGKYRFNAPEIVGAVGTDRVFGKLFAAWLARRDPSAEVVPNAFRIAATYRATEVLPIVRRHAANDFDPKRDVPPLVTIMALQLIAQLGTRADLPLFERHFGDETNVAAVDKPRPDGAKDYYRPAPLTETTQLRDVALGLALLLHGANPEDFGFVVRKDTFKQKDGRYSIPWSTQLHLGFKGDASRTAAFKKAKAWLDDKQKELTFEEQVKKAEAEVKKLGLVDVASAGDGIDTKFPIVFQGKGGEVSVKAGSAVLVELPKPTKVMTWQTGGFKPEAIGDADGPEFTHVFCKWTAKGKLTWVMYRKPAKD